MNRSCTSVTKVISASALAAAVAVVAGPVSAGSASLTTEVGNSSGALLYAGANLNGRPPYARDAARQQQMEKGQFARFEEQTGDADKSMYRGVQGRPPYNRHTANRQQMEKGQFARFEEHPGGAAGAEKSMYQGVEGKHPPYRRNW